MKWEYMYERSSEWKRDCDNKKLPDLDALDGLGADGWELVAVSPSWGNDPVTFIFKRPLVEEK